MLPTSTAASEDTALVLELQTAAICLIRRGSDPASTITSLLAFIKQEGISYPKEGSDVERAMWQVALARATPDYCEKLLKQDQLI
jgi:hypothetical protein